MDEQDKVKPQVPSTSSPTAGVRACRWRGRTRAGSCPVAESSAGCRNRSSVAGTATISPARSATTTARDAGGVGAGRGERGGFLRRGEERFGIHCSACHGKSGDGKGVTSFFGVPVSANQNANLAALNPEKYPDGRLFNTITKGMGQMSGYGYHVPVRDRWAIIAYVRALKAARAAPYEVVGQAFEEWEQAGPEPATAAQ